MDVSKKLENLILLNLVILYSVAIPHLIDDFLYGIPEEFGMSNLTAQFLAGGFTALMALVVILVTRGSTAGMIMAGVLGGFLALAAIIKHIPLILLSGPYWSGLFSESLIYGLVISGLSLSALSAYVLQVKRKAQRHGAE